MKILTVYNIHHTLHWFFRIMYDVRNSVLEACWNQHYNQKSACDAPHHFWHYKWKFRLWSCRVTKRFSANVKQLGWKQIYSMGRKSVIQKKQFNFHNLKKCWQIRFLSCWKIKLTELKIIFIYKLAEFDYCCRFFR